MDPTSRPDPDLLEYARHYGISEDPITRSPESYLVDSGLDNIFPDTAPSSPHSMRARHEELDSQLGHYLNRERLDIPIQDGRVMASIRELEREGAPPNWNTLLPPLQSMGSLRSEPLLKTQRQEQQERALQMGDGDAMPMDGGDASFNQQELTLMEFEKTPEVPEERSSSSSRSSSIRPVQKQPNRRAAHNTAAFVETVLAISKVRGLSTTILCNADFHRQPETVRLPEAVLPLPPLPCGTPPSVQTWAHSMTSWHQEA